MADFEHCDYGPMRLRRLLRRRLDPGERVVAWGPVMQAPEPHSALAVFALSIVPILGVLLSPVMYRTQRALLIITDRRILLLKSNMTGPLPEGRGVMLDEPVESVEVELRTHGMVDLFVGRRTRRRRLRVPDGRRQIAKSRLWRSLILLSEQEPPAFEEDRRAALDPRAGLPLDSKTDAA